MKKTVLTMLCLMAMSASYAQTTKRIMTVQQKDGTKVEYKVDNVERVSFSDKVYADLNNQWAFNEEVNPVNTVLFAESGENSLFAIHTAENVASDLVPDITIELPTSLIGQDVDLATAEGVVLRYKERELKKGTVKVKFDKFKKNVTISVEAEDGGDEVRCEYTGAFGRIYLVENSIKVSVPEQAVAHSKVASAFCVQPKATGEPTNFAFADVAATAPADFLSANVAVWFSVSAAKLYNGTIDMAADADSYTFRYIDYATRTVYDKVKSGTITTAQGYNGLTYVSLEAVLEDGKTVSLSYFGALTNTESLDEIIPSVVAENEYKYYNADGEVSITRQLGTSYMKEYKGNFTFYLIPEGDGKTSSDRVEVKVGSDLINAGEIDLANVGQEKIVDIKYNAGSIQLQSYAAGHGYGNMPNNGTLTVSKDENGVYEILLDVTNKYTNSYTTNGGDNTRIVVNYKGTFEAY